MHEEQVFYFFYKIETQKQMPLLVLKRPNYKSMDVILHFLNFLLIDKTQSFFCFFNKTKSSFLTILWTKKTKSDKHVWTSIFSLQEQTLLLVQILNQDENAASFSNYF